MPPEKPPAAPVRSTRRGSRPKSQANSAASRSSLRVSSSTAAGSAPFCGPNTRAASENRVVTSLRITSSAPRSPPRSSIAAMAPAPPSVVAEPPAATTMRRAPCRAASAIRTPVPYVLAVNGSRSPSEGRFRPLAKASSTTPVPSTASPIAASTGSPHGPAVLILTGRASSPRTRTPKVPSPPSATGSSRAAAPAVRMPAAMCPATSAAVKVPLKLSGAARMLIGSEPYVVPALELQHLPRLVGGGNLKIEGFQDGADPGDLRRRWTRRAGRDRSTGNLPGPTRTWEPMASADRGERHLVTCRRPEWTTR